MRYYLGPCIKPKSSELEAAMRLDPTLSWAKADSLVFRCWGEAVLALGSRV